MGNKQALTIAISTLKGGVGKTTTAVNLAAGVAERGKAALLVDMDPQASVRVSLSALMPAQTPDLAEVFKATNPADAMEIRAHSKRAGLDLALAGPELARMIPDLATRIGPEFLLRKALEIAKTHYDVIIIDTAPDLNVLTVNSLVAADRVLVPVEASALSIERVHDQLRALAEIAERLNPEIDLLGLLLTRVDGRYQRSNEEALESLQAAFGDLLLPTQIGVNSALNRAHHAGVDILSYEPKSRGAAQYGELAEWLINAMDSSDK